ncbi:MAG: MarR family winged helix-turn-helix transcriptional regulator [Parvibaculaceae bacterium]
MATKPTPETQNQDTGASGDDSTVEKTLLKNHFVRALGQLERLHRCLLELIKLELERQIGEQEVTSAQAVFLYNIGDGKLSATELRIRGYYTGSNLSYTIAKLVEGGYLNYERTVQDKRIVRLSLTEKGHQIRSMVAAVYEGHVPALEEKGITAEDLERLVSALKRLEHYWAEHIRYGF